VKKTSKKWKKRPPPSTENELNVSEMQNFQFFSRFGGDSWQKGVWDPKRGVQNPVLGPKREPKGIPKKTRILSGSNLQACCLYSSLDG